MTLRPYQADLDTRRRASAARRVCVQLPTGAGKSHLIRKTAHDYRSTITLVHAEWLLDQLASLLDGQQIKAGIQHDGSPKIIGMVQTIARRDLPEPDAILVDEAHHVVSPTFKNIIDRYPNARVFGFTATPERLDGVGLGSAFDELLCGPSYQELITGGYLKPFLVMSVPSAVDMRGATMRGGDYAQEDVKHAIRRSTIFGDVVEHYLLHARDLGGHASFWPNIEMAEDAAARFAARGVRCVALHSKMPKDHLHGLIRGLRDGSVESIASVRMLGEGLDVPGLASVSLCAPTMSLTKYLQECGRSNRGGPGKALILDHVANWTRHSLPDDDREWSLEGRLKRKAAPGVLPVWDCPACWTVNRSTCATCSRCGAAKPRVLVEAEERAAELELIIRADKGDIHDLCDTPAEYARFAKGKGQRPEWGALKWAERQKRHTNDNPFIAAAGTVRPTLREFLAAAEACGLHSGQARAYGRAVGLRY